MKLSLHRWKRKLPIYPQSEKQQAAQDVQHRVQDCVKADVIRHAAAVQAAVMAAQDAVGHAHQAARVAVKAARDAVGCALIVVPEPVPVRVKVAARVDATRLAQEVVQGAVIHVQAQVVHHLAGQLAEVRVPAVALIKERERGSYK